MMQHIFLFVLGLSSAASSLHNKEGIKHFLDISNESSGDRALPTLPPFNLRDYKTQPNNYLEARYGFYPEGLEMSGGQKSLNTPDASNSEIYFNGHNEEHSAAIGDVNINQEHQRPRSLKSHRGDPSKPNLDTISLEDLVFSFAKAVHEMIVAVRETDPQKVWSAAGQIVRILEHKKRMIAKGETNMDHLQSLSHLALLPLSFSSGVNPLGSLLKSFARAIDLSYHMNGDDQAYVSGYNNPYTYDRTSADQKKYQPQVYQPKKYGNDGQVLCRDCIPGNVECLTFCKRY